MFVKVTLYIQVYCTHSSAPLALPHVPCDGDWCVWIRATGYGLPIVWRPFAAHWLPCSRKTIAFLGLRVQTILPLVPIEQEEEAFQGIFGKLTSGAGYVAISSRRCENPAEPGLAGTCRYRFHFNQEASVVDPVYRDRFLLSRAW